MGRIHFSSEGAYIFKQRIYDQIEGEHMKEEKSTSVRPKRSKEYIHLMLDKALSVHRGIVSIDDLSKDIVEDYYFQFGLDRAERLDLVKQKPVMSVKNKVNIQDRQVSVDPKKKSISRKMMIPHDQSDNWEVFLSVLVDKYYRKGMKFKTMIYCLQSQDIDSMILTDTFKEEMLQCWMEKHSQLSSIYLESIGIMQCDYFLTYLSYLHLSTLWHDPTTWRMLQKVWDKKQALIFEKRKQNYDMLAAAYQKRLQKKK